MGRQMSKAILDAVCRRPATRPWSVVMTRAVLVICAGMIAFVNPVLALAVSVAFFAIYKMLDANAFNRHRKKPRSLGGKVTPFHR